MASRLVDELSLGTAMERLLENRIRARLYETFTKNARCEIGELEYRRFRFKRDLSAGNKLCDAVYLRPGSEGDHLCVHGGKLAFRLSRYYGIQQNLRCALAGSRVFRVGFKILAVV